jgi:hypothetical protein
MTFRRSISIVILLIFIMINTDNILGNESGKLFVFENFLLINKI